MIFVSLLGCVHAVSPELELAPAAADAPDPEPGELRAWRTWVLGGDPLVRHPKVPAALLDPGLAGWRAQAVMPEGDPSAWWFVESAGSGGPVVPFARGARLAAAEVNLPARGALLRWLVPLAEPGPVPFASPRQPLAVLGIETDEEVLSLLERSVLLGWLDGPGINTEAPATLLADPAWARLAATPAGALVIARAGHASGAAPAGAVLALHDATALALDEAAADAPAEYTAVRERRAALSGPNPSGDVVSDLLVHALAPLSEHAANDDAAGLALVAHAALRWRGHCVDVPCTGFDRVPELTAAARFGTDPARLAALWKVIAWKGAVDELWAAWDRPQVVHAMDHLVELLAGAAPRTLDLTAILRPAPDPAWTLAVTRASGGADGTSKEALFRALYGRVAVEAHAALAVAAEQAPVLDRIERRARIAAK